MRLTSATCRVLAVLLSDPTAEHYGYALLQATGLKSGALYPILERLHEQGWVERQWEPVEAAAGRPPRRYYRLTGAGARAGADAVNRWNAKQATVTGLRVRPA